MKKIVLAFDSFKGSISAIEACNAASNGVRLSLPDAEIIELPLSDGGEGLVDCLANNIQTTTVMMTAHGPLMENVEVQYALSLDGTTAYMEMAKASGLTLVPIDKRNPMLTTTYGVGDMIADAVKRGCKKIIIGLGGSATCDCGKGMIESLTSHRCLHPDCKIIVACDVTNPLYGPEGAAYVFGPQKGATEEQVAMLDQRLRDFASKTEQSGIADPSLAYKPGAGAAGGLGYALMAFLDAELSSGIDLMLDIVGFDEIINNASLVITGEGKSDSQTMMGKVPQGVLRRCRKAKVPVWLFSGAIDNSEEVLTTNFDLVKSINENDNRPLSELMRKEVASENLESTISKYINKQLNIRNYEQNQL